MRTTASARHLPVAKLLWLTLAVLAGLAALTQANDLRSIAYTVKSARWQFIILAAAVEVAFVLNLAMFFASSFRANRLPANTRRFVLLTSAAHFVNLASKSGGLGGIVLYLREGRRNGEPAARVMAGYFAAYALGYIAYFIFLATALILLYLRGSLSVAMTVAALITFVIIVALGTAVALAMRSETSLQRLYLLSAPPLNLVARLFRHPPFVDRSSAEDHAADLYEVISHMKQHLRSHVVPLVYALGVEILSVAMLYLTALALHADVNFATALVAQRMSLLFSWIAITPGGLGLVEASLSVLLVSFGLDGDRAIAVALSYRVFQFWLPVLLGAVSLRLLRDGLNRGDPAMSRQRASP